MRLETVARCSPVASAMWARDRDTWSRSSRSTSERFARRSAAGPAGGAPPGWRVWGGPYAIHATRPLFISEIN
jgi:hypothetical protein